jgi:glycosyltransferase involved in cell wall biosynthesis
MSQFVGRGKRIGFPIFELDTFNDIEKHHLSSLDHLFVCSNWAKGVVEENIPTLEGHISVIPLGVDQSIFQPDISHRSETVFFNCGKWEIRKGHDVLVDVFNQAFSEEDNVELWMMCENPFYSPEENLYWENLYKQSKLGDKIRIIPRQETQKEVYNIMRQVDCGVFLSRAEGWNLELLELMACGKHVIATDYSGHSQFCNKDNSLLVHIDEKESAVDNKWFFGEGGWAKIGHKQIQEAVYYMSMIHRAKKDGRLSQDTLTKSVIETAQQFSWENTAKEIVNAIAQQK